MNRLAVAIVALALIGIVAPAHAFHPMNKSHGYVMPKKWQRGKVKAWSSRAERIKRERRAAYSDRRRRAYEAREARALAARERRASREARYRSGRKTKVRASKPGTVRFSGYRKGSIVIDTAGRRLYYVLGGGRAYAYPVAVGKRGFTWSGTKTITRKQAWPDWRPPAEMRRRKPHLPKFMAGGKKNPLGAMALYLGSSLYRIHGTNDNSSIGQAVSSGCIRMRNSHVMHLARMAGVGTKVHVLKRLPKHIAARAGADRRG